MLREWRLGISQFASVRMSELQMKQNLVNNIWIVLVLLVFPAVQLQAIRRGIVINSVTASSLEIPLYGKLELTIDIDATYSNPYDPNDISVDGSFVSPAGKTMIMPGFFYRDFTYDSGKLTATDNWSWRVRFAPTEAGEWQYRVSVTTQSDVANSDVGTFAVTSSNKPGFVRIDPRNPHYFVFDNGTPYFPVGENVAWGSADDPIADYTKWIGSLAANQGNFARVWMAPWGFDIEWTDTGLGNYDGRQKQAYQLDRVMDLMAENNVYVMLSLLNHGQFSLTHNTVWDQNPFNAINGGPLDRPAGFASNADAIRLWNQRVRYVVARWGYSPNIMAWEWWNEVNWTPLGDPDLLVPWIDQSARYLRSLDPYGHLITISGSRREDEQVWNLDSIDFTQDHQYDLADLPGDFNEIIPQWLACYPNKPFLMGEFGSVPDTDTTGVFLHDGLWSAVMNGAAGTAMTWGWNNIVDPRNLYPQFVGISAFFRGEDLAMRHWYPTTAILADATKARVYGLQSPDEALLWVVSGIQNNTSSQSIDTFASGAGVPVEPNDNQLAGFEDGSDGWSLVTSWMAGINAWLSTENASRGEQALALATDFTGNGWQEAGVSAQACGAWPETDLLALDVYAPTDASDILAQLYTRTGGSRTWTNSQNLPLTPGRWNTLKVPVGTLGDVSALREFGIKIGSETARGQFTFYVDNVRLINTATIGSVPPMAAGADLKLTGLTAGLYTVELWDTIGGMVKTSSTQETTNGTLSLSLPQNFVDLAIKIKPVLGG